MYDLSRDQGQILSASDLLCLAAAKSDREGDAAGRSLACLQFTMRIRQIRAHCLPSRHIQSNTAVCIAIIPQANTYSGENPRMERSAGRRACRASWAAFCSEIDDSQCNQTMLRCASQCDRTTAICATTFNFDQTEQGFSTLVSNSLTLINTINHGHSLPGLIFYYQKLIKIIINSFFILGKCINVGAKRSRQHCYIKYVIETHLYLLFAQKSTKKKF